MDDIEQREVLRFLEGVEEGGLPSADLYNIMRNFEPILSFFLLKYLREKHPITENSSGPGQRLLELVSTYDSVQKLTKPPKEDEALAEWFDDTYDIKQFFNKPDEYVSIIIDKLES